MRVALAGLGGAALRGHLPALRQLTALRTAELVAVCDPNPARLTEAARLIPDVPRYPDIQSLLEDLDPEVLAIATDPAVHVELATHGMAHGCDILCEKPVALSRADYQQLREARERWLDRAVVPVHQYRYSPPWARFAAWARALPDEPIYLTVQVERPGTDPHAASPWRADPRSGGGLADHGVHYLALARELRRPMSVHTAKRTYDNLGREQVRCQLGIGPGVFELAVNYGAQQRRTTVTLHLDARSLRWCGSELTWANAGRPVRHRQVPALSDRTHVDSLYLPLYEEFLANRASHGWRGERWQEVLEVGEMVVEVAALADETTVSCPRPAS